MSETKLQYQQRMQRKFERQSEDNTRLTNELQSARGEICALKARIDELSAAEERSRIILEAKNHWADRAREAEAEIKRRDSMDPVAYRYAYLPYVGEDPSWKYVDSIQECNTSSGYSIEGLFSSAPVLPPEWTFDDAFKFAAKYEFAEPAVMALQAWNACRKAMLKGGA